MAHCFFTRKFVPGADSVGWDTFTQCTTRVPLGVDFGRNLRGAAKCHWLFLRWRMTISASRFWKPECETIAFTEPQCIQTWRHFLLPLLVLPTWPVEP
jgi:hypothetical protein